MSALNDTRQRLTTALEDAGLTVYDHVPERIVPPAVLVTPGNPYVTSGDTFGTFTVATTATVVTAKATNETESAALDGLIETAIVAAVNEGFAFDNASPFYPLEANTAVYLAANISLTDTITL